MTPEEQRADAIADRFMGRCLVHGETERLRDAIAAAIRDAVKEKEEETEKMATAAVRWRNAYLAHRIFCDHRLECEDCLADDYCPEVDDLLRASINAFKLTVEVTWI